MATIASVTVQAGVILVSDLHVIDAAVDQQARDLANLMVEVCQRRGDDLVVVAYAAALIQEWIRANYGIQAIAPRLDPVEGA